MADKRVALLIAEGLEEVEGLAVYDLLFRAHIPVDLVSITGRLEVTSSHGLTFMCSALIEDVDLASYTLVVLPGGVPGTPHLAAHPRVTEELRRRMKANEPLAAICAAPSIVAELGLLDGRKATSHPSYQHVLSEHGATLVDAPVVEDGNLVTSQGMGTATLFGLKLIETLLGAQAAQEIAHAIALPV